MKIAALLVTKHVITLKHMDIQMQSGTYDCGLFAIVLAPVLCMVNILASPYSMRQHLIKCLELGEITLFPVNEPDKMQAASKTKTLLKFIALAGWPKSQGGHD